VKLKEFIAVIEDGQLQDTFMNLALTEQLGGGVIM
jgi:hypothetical protein